MTKAEKEKVTLKRIFFNPTNGMLSLMNNSTGLKLGRSGSILRGIFVNGPMNDKNLKGGN